MSARHPHSQAATPRTVRGFEQAERRVRASLDDDAICRQFAAVWRDLRPSIAAIYQRQAERAEDRP